MLGRACPARFVKGGDATFASSRERGKPFSFVLGDSTAVRRGDDKGGGGALAARSKVSTCSVVWHLGPGSGAGWSTVYAGSVPPTVRRRAG